MPTRGICRSQATFSRPKVSFCSYGGVLQEPADGFQGRSVVLRLRLKYLRAASQLLDDAQVLRPQRHPSVRLTDGVSGHRHGRGRVMSDVLTIYALGEQVYCLSRDFKALHPDVDWAGISGLRH